MNMKQWFRNMAEEAKERAYLDGYDWAAGRLLRGEVSIEQIELRAVGAESDPFDRGATAAALAWSAASFVKEAPHELLK